MFADRGPTGPTGLYTMAGDGPLGPFALVNGTGLVAGNPPSAPLQVHSWWVLDDLRVNSRGGVEEVYADMVNNRGLQAITAREHVVSLRMMELQRRAREG